MTMGPDMAAFVAGELERGSGSLCGACGSPHATSAADYDGPGERCGCPCCFRYLHESCVAEWHFPDLIDRHGNVSASAADEAIRRLERDLALRVKALAGIEARNAAYVADTARRRTALSSAHHQEVAALPPAQADDQLDPDDTSTLDDATVTPTSDAPRPRLATAGQIRQLRRLRVEIRDDLTAEEAAQTIDLYLNRRATWSTRGRR